MTPEKQGPKITEIEDPITRRFAEAVDVATRNGQRVLGSYFDFHEAGNLTVAVARRTDSPVFSVFAKDDTERDVSSFKGVNLDPKYGLRYARPVVQEIHFEYPVSLEEFMNLYVAGVLNKGEGYFKGRENKGHDNSSALSHRFWEKIGDIDYFEEVMNKARNTYAQPHALGKVSEGLEIVAAPKRFGRRRRRLEHAETLFREGLGLTD